jgi:hypothetical protein
MSCINPSSLAVNDLSKQNILLPFVNKQHEKVYKMNTKNKSPLKKKWFVWPFQLCLFSRHDCLLYPGIGIRFVQDQVSALRKILQRQPYIRYLHSPLFN